MLKVNEKTGEIFLYGVIGPEEIGGDFTEFDVMNALDSLDGKRAKVRVNSPGGAFDVAVAAYRTLKEYSGGVDTYNDSLAASAASVVMLAGENRVSPVGSRWMIHRARSPVQAMLTMAKLKDMIATFEAYDQDLVAIYKDYMNLTEDEIAAKLDAETWIRADEALSMGLSTDKSGSVAAKPRMAAWFENPPTDFIAACAGEVATIKPFPVLRQAAKLRR